MFNGVKRRLWIVPLLLAAGFSGQGSAAAAGTLSAPGGFRLPASHGYSIHAITFDGDPRGESDELILFVARKGDGAAYFVQKDVSITETTVSADLGILGSIDLRFVPSGARRLETSACGGHPIEFDSGSYQGRIDFEGEEGYTQAHATWARGEIRALASLICARGVDEGFGDHSPGARLQVRRSWKEGRVELDVTKNSPRRATRLQASIEERRGAMAVERSVSAEVGAGAFKFDVPAQVALVSPPAPFSGSARFVRPAKAAGLLRGNLDLDFPGRSDVSLNGSRGSLQRWVEHPSHPFRPAAWLAPKAR